MHFISLKYFSRQKLNKLIKLSLKIKRQPHRYRNKLVNKQVGLIFEKPSLRTKCAFYVGAEKLGARSIYFSREEIQLGVRESIPDIARTVSSYLDAVVLRTFSHNNLLEFVKYSSIPVINALTDYLHPSQVLGDFLTIYELKKDIKKIKFSFIGDANNNVAHSLIYGFSILGGNLYLACPKNYQPSFSVMQEAKIYAKVSGAKIFLTHKPQEAAEGADIIYTDVWVSMGKEKEAARRKKSFKDFQINGKILKKAKKNCLIMHCLPAHRGEEITDEVLESKNSIVFLQAENRLYAAEAILVSLLKNPYMGDKN